MSLLNPHMRCLRTTGSSSVVAWLLTLFLAMTAHADDGSVAGTVAHAEDSRSYGDASSVADETPSDVTTKSNNAEVWALSPTFERSSDPWMFSFGHGAHLVSPPPSKTFFADASPLSLAIDGVQEHATEREQRVVNADAHTPLFLEDRVRVAIYSVSGERLTLQKQRHVTIGKENIIFRTTTRTYEDFCTTPCHLEVTAGAYRFAVAEGANRRKERTLDVRQRVDIYEDTELWLRHRNRRPARVGFYSAMAASVVAGLAVGIVSAIEQRDEGRTLSPSRGPLMGTLSFSLVLAGAGFFVGGVLSRDTYTVVPRGYTAPAQR